MQISEGENYIEKYYSTNYRVTEGQSWPRPAMGLSLWKQGEDETHSPVEGSPGKQQLKTDPLPRHGSDSSKPPRA